MILVILRPEANSIAGNWFGFRETLSVGLASVMTNQISTFLPLILRKLYDVIIQSITNASLERKLTSLCAELPQVNILLGTLNKLLTAVDCICFCGHRGTVAQHRK